MAKFVIKFRDFDEVETRTIEVFENGNQITIYFEDEGFSTQIDLDKSTAIKFAKTLRTEINKITESEVYNG
jgi:hypothetical protein